MIAKDILRPGKLARLRSNSEFGFKYLLVVVVARTQHHTVLAECDRLLVVICRNVLTVRIGIAHPKTIQCQ